MARRLTILALFCAMGFSPSLFADEQKTEKSSGSGSTEKKLSKEDRAYDEQMRKVSDLISKKIAEIQKKEKDIANEVYPAYVPELKAEKAELEKQLDYLQLKKTQLEAQKTSRELTKTLEKNE